MATSTTWPWSNRAVRRLCVSKRCISGLMRSGVATCFAQWTCKSPSDLAAVSARCDLREPAGLCIVLLTFTCCTAGWAVPSGFMKYNSITGEYAGDVSVSMA